MTLTKAAIVNVDAGNHVIHVMFNPASYSLSRSVHYKEERMPKKQKVPVKYISGTADSLSMALFFDTTNTGADVRQHTRVIEDLMLPRPNTKNPPRLRLIWGSLEFNCHLISVRSEFDYFNSVGMALRARMQVEFKGQETASATVDAASPSTVRLPPGQSLPNLAAQRYEDPAKWRLLAEANDIDDPRKISPGIELNLPEAP